MFQEEAIALVAELGGTPDHMKRMRSIISGLLSSARQSSVLTDLIEPGRVVTLGGDAPEATLVGVVSLGSEAEATEERPVVGVSAPRDRYDDLCLLGRGGMGEVRRVRDRDLGRTLAMKIASARVMGNPGALARFIEEAQVSAQLQHPGILPVHELGRLPDGRCYFTMQEVRGRTLEDVISEVHLNSSGDRWEAAPSADGSPGWTFRRLVDAFHRVCETVSYAHERGVVHRDLKPGNIMVGAHGEVLVLDWGIAKVTGRPDLAAEQGELTPEGGDLIVTDRSQDSAQATRMGAVAGTPAYMPPEQALGQIDRIDARSDIYALGAVLYELLSGRRPYAGSGARQVLQMVRSGPPEPLGRQASARDTFVFGLDFIEDAATAGPPLPEELVAACERSMSREPERRFDNATELAAVVRDWLDGAKRREQALAVAENAKAHQPEAAALRARAEALRVEAAALLAEIKSWEPEEEKAPGWAKQDEADALERQATLAELKVEQGLEGALRVDPTLPEAHEALAERLLREHRAAEAARDPDPTAQAEAGLREHAGALPEGHEVRIQCAAYLKGDGALSLVTDPPGAEVLLHRFVLHNRRLVPKFERSLGRTPLRGVTLPMGSYLCLLRHPEHAEVRYPVSIGRQEHWDGVRPGDRESTPIILPVHRALGADDVYVPPGWFWAGGDDDVSDCLPRRRLWVDALVMRRFPITNTEYITFLNDLLDQGREDEALCHVPREKGGTADELGAMIYGRVSPDRVSPDRDEDRRFVLRSDAEGDTWDPEWPVLMVDWFGTAAWCRWLAEKTGRPWRLPGELEWEKAARGVDGRFYPWGDHIDPSWCCYRDSHRGRRLPTVVDSFPVDVSVYGVRGMGGNARDRCADSWDKSGPIVNELIVSGPPVVPSGAVKSAARGTAEPEPSRVLVRGGAWCVEPRVARASHRRGLEPRDRNTVHGGRAVFRPSAEHLKRVMSGRPSR